MNGAQALIRTLTNSGITTCFMNPGTSEMHFVAELDSVKEMRPVLTLFEGVATGAADGFSRITCKPGVTLLHLGPGLANGCANLHNAKKAKSPVLNIVGDHATYHKRYDAPLESDIESIAKAVSGWVRTTLSINTVALDTCDALLASVSPSPKVATLILPADISWNEGALDSAVSTWPRPSTVDENLLIEVADILRKGEKTAILLGGAALERDTITEAAKIAKNTGAKLLCETFPRKIERGGSTPEIERLAYLGELCQLQLDGIKYLILIHSKAPVSFFAYPAKESYLVPNDAKVIELVRDFENPMDALLRLSEHLGSTKEELSAKEPPAPTKGNDLTPQSFAQVIGDLLPEGSVVSDESNTLGIHLANFTKCSNEHIWMCLTGGAIGQGLPLATGAAIADRSRKVLAIEADGSSMYTIQSLWTQAREGANITNIILDNQSYGVLEMELGRVGAKGAGEKAYSMLDLSSPSIDFQKLGASMGLEAYEASSVDEFRKYLKRSLDNEGPSLIHLKFGRGLIL